MLPRVTLQSPCNLKEMVVSILLQDMMWSKSFLLNIIIFLSQQVVAKISSRSVFPTDLKDDVLWQTSRRLNLRIVKAAFIRRNE